MIVKFNKRGAGSGASAVAYLTGEFGTVDGKMPTLSEQAEGIGRRSVPPVVLRGDPEQTQRVIGGLEFARKYTSGCLSFTESDLPSAKKTALMDTFEATLMAGLDADQYECCWVEHRDKGRLELNFLIANVELHSGKRLQPYYDRADRPRVNAWQEMVNDHFELSSPHDPARARPYIKSEYGAKEAHTKLEAWFKGAYQRGEIQSRSDIERVLQEANFAVTRETATSISIKNPNGGRNIRFRGELFHRDFDGALKSGDSSPEQAAEQKQATLRTYKASMQLKTAANQEKYPRSQAVEEVTAPPRNTDTTQPETGYDRARATVDAALRAATDAVRAAIHRVSQSVEFAGRISEPDQIRERQQWSADLTQNQEIERGASMHRM